MRKLSNELPRNRALRYLMELFISYPERFRRVALALAEGRGIIPLPSHPPKHLRRWIKIIGFLIVWNQFAHFRSVAQENDSIPTTIMLKQVVITASRSEKEIFDIGRYVTVIDSEEIRNSAYDNVGELLARQEGIYVVGATQTPGTNQSLFLRGANSNHTSVLIDGLRITDPSTPNSALDLSELSLANVKRIEIIRGSHSTMFGSASMGGVINIITKDPELGSNASIQLKGGTFGKKSLVFSQNLEISHSFQNGLYLLGAVQNQHVNGLNASIDTISNPSVFKTTDSDDFKKLDWITKIGYRNDNWEIFGSVRRVDQEAEIDDGAFNDDDNYVLKFDRYLYDYKLKYDINPGLNLQFRGAYTKSDRASVNDSSVVDNVGNTDRTYFESRHQGELSTNEIQANYNGNKITTVLGAGRYMEDMKFRTFFFSDGFFGPFELETNYDSINSRSWTDFLFLQTNIGGSVINLPSLSLTLGGRLSNHNKFGTNFSYEINPTLKIFNKSILFGSYSTGFNAPSLNQLFDPSQSPGSITSRGNIDLKPEISNTFEVGIKQLVGANGLLTISYFNTIIKDAIEYVYLWNDSLGIENLSFIDYWGDTYINIAEHSTQGVELNFNMDISDKLSINIGASYIDGKLKSMPGNNDLTLSSHVQLFSNGEFINRAVESNGLIRRPDHSINIGLKYRPVKSLSFTGRLKRVSSRFDSVYDPTLGPFGALADTKLGGYSLFDVQGNFILNKNLSVTLQVDNLLNENYSEIQGFNSRGRSIFLKLSAQLQQ